MIRDGIDVFYYAQPVDSDDQAISLVEYLSWHGWPSFKDETNQHQVVVPLEAGTKEDAAEKSASVFNLVGTWRLFWKHRDKGLFDLPVYIKD